MQTNTVKINAYQTIDLTHYSPNVRRDEWMSVFVHIDPSITGREIENIEIGVDENGVPHIFTDIPVKKWDEYEY